MKLKILIKEARIIYKNNSSLYLRILKLLKYKDKDKGRNLLVYIIQPIS